VVASLAEQRPVDATTGWATGDGGASQDDGSIQPDLRVGSAR